MSANETIHVSETGGQKAGNLERYDLIPAEPLRQLAVHAATRNFGGRPGSYARMMDHAWRFWAGEEMDAACDFPHLIAAAWEAFRIVDPTFRPAHQLVGDSGAARYDRIPAGALRQLARHFGVGAQKYDDDNWRRGYDWRLTFAAANRHAEQWRAGENIDAETGSNHLIAFAWHMLVLDEFTRIHPEFDTRTSTKLRQWLDAERLYLRNPETVAALEDAEANINEAVEVKLWLPGEPRVVDRLDVDERGAAWMDNRGSRWEFDERSSPQSGWTIRSRTTGKLVAGRCAYVSLYGPFTEIIDAADEAEPPRPQEPRKVTYIDKTHKAHDWTDCDGDVWHWIDDHRGSGYALKVSSGEYTIERNKRVGMFGPFAEIL